jgi:hypothetical protein
MARIAPEILMKSAADSVLAHMDFSADVESTESIASVTSAIATPTGLTVGTPTFDDDTAQVRLSGGTAGITYTVVIKVVTNNSNIFEGTGYLQVT